jgi:uncharacterized protein YegP (UPF0339 family)
MKLDNINFNKKQYMILFLLVSFLFSFIFLKWIYYVYKSKESFTNGIISEKYDGSTSHTVDLPLTTSYSCTNFCGPTARCSITGQQCFADIDCPGCQPYSPPLKQTADCVPGDNDAGKMTGGVTPQYSSLTSGYGTHEKIITSNMYEKPDMANFGVDIWKQNFNEENKLFDKRYKPSGLQYMPNYPKRYSLTGDFIEDGPYPSNAQIN